MFCFAELFSQHSYRTFSIKSSSIKKPFPPQEDGESVQQGRHQQLGLPSLGGVRDLSGRLLGLEAVADVAVSDARRTTRRVQRLQIATRSFKSQP